MGGAGGVWWGVEEGSEFARAGGVWWCVEEGSEFARAGGVWWCGGLGWLTGRAATGVTVAARKRNKTEKSI